MLLQLYFSQWYHLDKKAFIFSERDLYEIASSVDRIFDISRKLMSLTLGGNLLVG